MGAPTSLLQNARAFARDYSRDSMPKGYLWDVADFVPTLSDAPLTGRGGWRWGSDDLGGLAETGILAPFLTGDQLLFQTSAGRLIRVNPNPPYNTIADLGSLARGLHNPVFRHDEAVWFDGNGTQPPRMARSGGLATAPASAPHARVGCSWGEFLVVGGAPSEEDVVRFSHPTNDLATAGGWDAASSLRTSGRVSALAALRAMIMVFHPGSTERIRGSIPPNSTAADDDLTLEPLFSRIGCTEPKSIAYWNENVLFADEHGVHISDGAVVRNLVSQGGIHSYWRLRWETRTSVAACVFLDYYIISLPQTSGEPLTLVVDLERRQWFRFTNIPAISYIASGGSTGMERVWAGMSTTNRTMRIGPVFFPDNIGQLNDDDGAAVLPSFETPWYRLAEEGRKRIRFGYLSYDTRQPSGYPTVPALEVGYIRSPQVPSYTALGQLPYTGEYSRYRLPLGQFPYGVAFRVRQVAAAGTTRIFDLGVEAQAAERSRV